MTARLLLPLALVLLATACGSDELVMPAPPDAPRGAPLPMARTSVPAATRLVGAAIDEFRSSGAVKGAYSDGARKVIEDPESVQLYSLVTSAYRPYGYGRKDAPSPYTNIMQALGEGDGVLGKVAIGDRTELAQVVGGMYRGLAQHGPVAGCFEPRHALVFSRGEEDVVALICFQCHYLVPLEESTEKGRYRGFQDQANGLRELLNRRLAAEGVRVAD